MEVTSINQNITNHNSSQNLTADNNIRVSVASQGGSPAVSTRASDFDYDNVMMNLEDVKNFLFMLIGGEITRVSAAENRGSNVNTLA